MSTAELLPDQDATPENSSAESAVTKIAKPLVNLTPPKTLCPEPAPLPPKPKSARYESLDIWRGVACLLLVFYHAAFFRNDTMRVFDPSSWSIAGALLYCVKKTWCGVPIFFVISGYCIAASLDSLRRRPHSLSNYFYRRVRRIYPPLFVAMVLAIGWLAVAQNMWNLAGAREYLPYLSELSASQWFGNFTATEQWLHNFRGGHPRYLMANTWTLCYEEQFYALAGLMLLCAPRRPLTVALWISLAVLVGRHVLRAFGCSGDGFFYDGHWLLFAGGLLVYQTVNYFTRPQAIGAYCIFAAGVVYGLWERKYGGGWFERHLGEYFIVASLFALFLIATKRFDLAIARNRLAQPLIWCGKRSYSIYLAHYTFVVPIGYAMYCAGLSDEWSTVFITLPLGLAVSLLTGWAFYMLVERHFQNTDGPPAQVACA